ncbi:MAG: hypothetical protein ABL996_15600 [Micropepsaceae bacterium]
MKTRVLFGLLMAAAAALGLAACDNGTTAPSGGVTQVVSTTSFGMCMGYCKTRLELSPGKAVLVREPGGRGAPTLPVERKEEALAPQEWKEIADLAAAAKIDGLPDVIGCPDCADGGAESLSIVGPGRNKTITFDHGAKVDEAQSLLDRVRAIRTRMTPPQP